MDVTFSSVWQREREMFKDKDPKTGSFVDTFRLAKLKGQGLLIRVDWGRYKHSVAELRDSERKCSDRQQNTRDLLKPQREREKERVVKEQSVKLA